MSNEILFSKWQLGRIELRNRLVMAPMTRNRSIDNVPGDIAATYYAQRVTPLFANTLPSSLKLPARSIASHKPEQCGCGQTRRAPRAC